MDQKVTEILEAMEAEAEFRLVIKRGLEIVKSYGPDLKELVRGVASGMADIKIEMIHKYEANGFTREEAIFLVMDEWFAIARNARTGGKKK
jgi:hypothetical protein